MLKIVNLTKKNRQKLILNNLTCEVARGTIAIFLGGSGAGKTTLLRILNNLETYNQGAITLDEVPLNLKTVHATHSVGMVFQHFNLFEHLNVLENITLPLIKGKGIVKEEADRTAHRLLKHYGLEEKAHEWVTKLSGGQKQRLAIARTLALDPKIICLDEPTSALDPKLTSQVATLLMELAAENRIVLVTTHDMGLVDQLQGQLFLMEQGQIVETASTSMYASHPQAFPLLSKYRQD